MSKDVTILVVVEGGLIQDVVGVPSNHRVVVRDYDVEGTDLEDYLERGLLFVGPQGDLCTQIEWGPSVLWDDGTREATEADIEH